jgi:hypothetical protein
MPDIDLAFDLLFLGTFIPQMFTELTLLPPQVFASGLNCLFAIKVILTTTRTPD